MQAYFGAFWPSERHIYTAIIREHAGNAYIAGYILLWSSQYFSFKSKRCNLIALLLPDYMSTIITIVSVLVKKSFCISIYGHRNESRSCCLRDSGQDISLSWLNLCNPTGLFEPGRSWESNDGSAMRMGLFLIWLSWVDHQHPSVNLGKVGDLNQVVVWFSGP